MNVQLVTTLKRQTTKLLELANKTKQPILITEYGKPSVYIVDAQSYEATQQKLSLLETIARGERAIKEKRVLSHSSAKQALSKWLK